MSEQEKLLNGLMVLLAGLPTDQISEEMLAQLATMRRDER